MVVPQITVKVERPASAFITFVFLVYPTEENALNRGFR
jgi:hypothetical protein